MAPVLAGMQTLVFPKSDALKDKSAKTKRSHVCSVCSRAFKRSEHCIRHQRARKSPRALAIFPSSSPFDSPSSQTLRKNRLRAGCVGRDTVASISTAVPSSSDHELKLWVRNRDLLVRHERTLHTADELAKAIEQALVSKNSRSPGPASRWFFLTFRSCAWQTLT